MNLSPCCFQCTYKLSFTTCSKKPKQYFNTAVRGVHAYKLNTVGGERVTINEDIGEIHTLALPTYQNIHCIKGLQLKANDMVCYFIFTI